VAVTVIVSEAMGWLDWSIHAHGGEEIANYP
jgi:hypothetical protein